MQILLNENEVKVAITDYIQGLVTVSGEQAIQVELSEDGAIVFILNPDEPAGFTSPASTDERPPKKSRRTKAQIEADNKAEAERLAKATEAGANGSDTSGNAVASTQQAVVETQVVQAEVAGETTQEPSAPGTEPEVDPSNAVATTVVVEQPAEEPVIETPATVEEPAAEEPVVETPPVKPTTSLFANLRKPNNQ